MPHSDLTDQIRSTKPTKHMQVEPLYTFSCLYARSHPHHIYYNQNFCKRIQVTYSDKAPKIRPFFYVIVKFNTLPGGKKIKSFKMKCFRISKPTLKFMYLLSMKAKITQKTGENSRGRRDGMIALVSEKLSFLQFFLLLRRANHFQNLGFLYKPSKGLKF